MGRLLNSLLKASSAYAVRRDEAGFTLTRRPDQAAEFNSLVRSAIEHSGEDCIVFPTSDGEHGYSQMFVLPLDQS